VRLALKAFWTPVGAGVKTDEEVDALTLHLFGDAPAGRAAIREIDDTIAALPGLSGLTLLEDVLDRALRRARRRPGSAGVGPGVCHGVPAAAEPAGGASRAPAPTHWGAPTGERDDALAPVEAERGAAA
jgi:hypothetical protein